ncbi:FeoA family protein [Sorangium sp. So ce590]|uniref:FeoA family protein n=1 Tax=unclassified Sorangium TaxID=2621164 RepID=UPI003F62145D
MDIPNLGSVGVADGVADMATAAHDARAAVAASPLAKASTGQRVVVIEVGLEADLAGWLGAMGLGSGQTLTVIRRAAFGGPLHVRTGSGGELAINAGLARSILVAPLAAPRRIT